MWNDFARRLCNGVDLRHTSSGNHILIFSFDISVDTCSGPCSGVSYLGHFKNHWTEYEYDNAAMQSCHRRCRRRTCLSIELRQNVVFDRRTFPARYRSTNQANSAFHPFEVDKWAVSCNWMSATSVRGSPSGEHLPRKGRHGVRP